MARQAVLLICRPLSELAVTVEVVAAAAELVEAFVFAELVLVVFALFAVVVVVAVVAAAAAAFVALVETAVFAVFVVESTAA